MVSQKTKNMLERMGIVLSLIGLFCMLQPFSMTLYQYGFQLLCIGGILYIILGYIPTGSSIKKIVLIVAGVLTVLFGFLILGIILVPTLVG